MFHPSTARAQRASRRRTGAAALLVAGLLSGGLIVTQPVAVVSAATMPAADVIGLHKGASGDDVRALQNALNRAGIGVKYGVDGYFGSATQASVRAFQRYKHLPVTGVVDAATAAALGFGVKPAPVATVAPAAATTSGLARGARGAQVTALQQALIKAGVPPSGGADGIFGAGTAAAVKAFQGAKGIAATGVVDAVTANALGLGGFAAPKATAAATPDPGVLGLRLGSQGPAVAQVQQAIIKMGWPLARGADGVFGVSTQRALMAIQRANSLKVTGAMNIATARLLRLTQAPAAQPTAQPAAQPAPATQPAASAATAAGYPTFDEHGARVVALQAALVAAGIVVRGGTDGVFGSGTLNALLAFQRAKGLPATGKIDAATAAALGLSPINPPAAAAIAVSLEAKPVQGPCYYGDSWLAARSVGRVHLGVDILAAEGNQVFAVAAGTVTKLYSPEHDPLTGNGLRITRADGTYFFYGHMSALAPGIAVGTPVSAGQLVGYVGHTGNAGVNHLHLEIHPGGGSAVNPYPLVKAFGAC
jgi:peptidoglycan hydrolase-like protein with peptidoglycan-binding domain